MHLNSVLLFEKYGLKYFSNSLKVLEIGPSGYPSIFCQRVEKLNIVEWHTLDMSTNFIDGGEKNPNHIISASEYNYPIEDNAYDVVIAGQVIEHVKKTWVWLKELKRVTKKNGLIILINPVSWPYHEAPVDCWRIYPEGMKALAEEAGLEVMESRFESIEKELLGNVATIPGQSLFLMNKRLRSPYRVVALVNKILGFVPGLGKVVAIPVAYDTISILRKGQDK
jgi:ubiquinone/menaquinone biosynthesis C-methylase UbiE